MLFFRLNVIRKICKSIDKPMFIPRHNETNLSTLKRRDISSCFPTINCRISSYMILRTHTKCSHISNAASTSKIFTPHLTYSGDCMMEGGEFVVPVRSYSPKRTSVYKHEEMWRQSTFKRDIVVTKKSTVVGLVSEDELWRDLIVLRGVNLRLKTPHIIFGLGRENRVDFHHHNRLCDPKIRHSFCRRIDEVSKFLTGLIMWARPRIGA